MIESDADRLATYFNPDEFGTTATIDGVPDVPCFFSDDLELVQISMLTVETSAPVLGCNTSDVAAVANGATAVVAKNGKSYTIKKRRANDEGLTVFELTEA